ncbi:MAG: AraC family transcriptional regulator [Fuerstiella sp.]|nr:AraC family transcriptional regulator [Fuerstiella sp.]MCP4858100.1 AraC family transcriptional regulator [Fuerstiella sp.]
MTQASSKETGRAFSDAFFRQQPDAQSVIELFDYLPSALFYAKDAQHRYVAVNNRTMADVFGLDDLEALLGRTDSDFQPPALAEAYHAEDRRVMESGHSIPNQVWLVPHVRGVPRWYVSSKTPLSTPNGSVIGIAGVMYPIDTPDEQASFFQELLSAVRFMDENYMTTISMKEMAEIAGLSSTHFNFRFRNILRMSPTEYIMSRRIQDAQKLLTGTSQAISQIAATVGFFDQSHFTKRFRKFTGMTPLAYRKRFR